MCAVICDSYSLTGIVTFMWINVECSGISSYLCTLKHPIELTNLNKP